jgi:hypothetical protein
MELVRRREATEKGTDASGSRVVPRRVNSEGRDDQHTVEGGQNYGGGFDGCTGSPGFGEAPGAQPAKADHGQGRVILHQVIAKRQQRREDRRIPNQAESAAPLALAQSAKYNDGQRGGEQTDAGQEFRRDAPSGVAR